MKEKSKVEICRGEGERKKRNEDEVSNQSFSKKSQSMAVSGVFREQPNILFSDSLWVFSGLHVRTSHMRIEIRPRVTTTT